MNSCGFVKQFLKRYDSSCSFKEALELVITSSQVLDELVPTGWENLSKIWPSFLRLGVFSKTSNVGTSAWKLAGPCLALRKEEKEGERKKRLEKHQTNVRERMLDKNRWERGRERAKTQILCKEFAKSNYQIINIIFINLRSRLIRIKESKKMGWGSGCLTA